MRLSTMSQDDPKAAIVRDRAPKHAGPWRPVRSWRTEYATVTMKQAHDRYSTETGILSVSINWPSIGLAGISSYYSAATNQNKSYHITTVIQLRDINPPVLSPFLPHDTHYC